MSTPKTEGWTPLAKCTSEDLIQVRTFARRMAIRKGKAHFAEDFGSFVIEYVVRQGELKYNLNWLWADFTRLEEGLVRTKKGSAKRLGLARTVSDEAAVQVEDPRSLQDEGLDWAGLLKQMDPQTRVVAVLKFKWGFVEHEIAEVLGVTNTRVNQIMTKLCERGQKMKFMKLAKGFKE